MGIEFADEFCRVDRSLWGSWDKVLWRRTERVPGPDEDDIVQPDGSEERIVRTPSDACHVCENLNRQSGSKQGWAAKTDPTGDRRGDEWPSSFRRWSFRSPRLYLPGRCGRERQRNQYELRAGGLAPPVKKGKRNPSWAQMTTTRSSDPEAR